jgi:hypothetical protein
MVHVILVSICIGIAVWCLYMGVKFYRRADWDEPAESSPDFGQMRKREAELQHVQDVLQAGHDQGSLSQGLLEEFNRFADQEIAEMKAVETAWKNRKKPAPSP